MSFWFKIPWKVVLTAAYELAKYLWDKYSTKKQDDDKKHSRN